MTDRENMLRTVRFETPDHIPMRVGISGACWNHYPHDALQDLMAAHPLLFPGFRRSEDPVPEFKNEAQAGVPYRDEWGCVWETTEDGIVGAVTGHPLASWDAFEGYAPPDPQRTKGRGPVDWAAIAQGAARAREEDRLTQGGLVHGHTFLLLNYLCGYANLIYAMVDADPRLIRLIRLIEDFNRAVIRRYLALGVEWMSYPEDLGMQVGPMLSPDQFRRFIKPTYQRMMQPARDAGCIVHMHSDGDIRALVDDLIDGGVEVINLQDLVNGIDWIAAKFAGKVCIDLDVDRQNITCFGTPPDIDALIREEVEKLGSKQGGLMMIYGFYPGTPLENARAVMDAMERYAGYYA